MAITAKDVQELRKSTGAGMMDAKKALTEADGDFEAAVQILREKGLAKAAIRADRDNTEGLVVVVEDDNAAAMVHLKSETDFSAKNEEFVSLANDIAAAVLVEGAGAADAFQARVDDLKLNIKENIELGLAVRYEKSDDYVIDAYLHGGGRAGVLIEAEGVDDETLHEIALHVAFGKPKYLSRDDVPAEDVEKERVALLEITKSEGKPEAAWDKIVEGRVNSWFSESVLLEQGVFGDKETVAAKIGSGSIKRFALAMVG
ncbi:MAG: translation elongation factor Ts [Acidimicrobiales bacterium]|nr:translation elongation factor Ts [Acidimicrobiales bacterium]